MARDDDKRRHPLKPVCEAWLKKIDLAQKVKHERFGKWAEECARFYDSAHDWMWKDQADQLNVGGYLEGKGDGPMPRFRMQMNRAFEAVALYGPTLIARYPQVLVTPVNRPEVSSLALGMLPDDPAYQELMAAEQAEREVRQTHASIQQYYANWLQREGDKKLAGRKGVTQAIVKGWGILWTEMYRPPGSKVQYPLSRYISCDDVVKDPDAKYEEDVQWIARRRCGAVNIVEEHFELQPGTLKGQYQSGESQSTPKGRKEQKTNKHDGQSHDLIEYWEIYSKNGFGHRLCDLARDKKQENYDALGDFCYIVVAKGVPFPLNLPTVLMEQFPRMAEEANAEMEQAALLSGEPVEPVTPVDLMAERTAWPAPFWTDPNCDGGWPMAQLGFYESDGTYPLPMLKPVVGELRFINWCMSFLADKVASVCTDYVGVMKSAAEEIQGQLRTQSGPMKLIEISDMMGKSVKDVISFIESPQFNVAIWQMLAQVIEQVDRKTGITELLAGMSGQRAMRSAEEATIRQANTQIRPDDMADKVEQWLSNSARKEMIAAFWHAQRSDYEPVVGPLAAQVWETQMATRDFDLLVRDFSFTIEAGSARKPNLANRLNNLNEIGSVALPVLSEMAAAGNVSPWNSHWKAWGEAAGLDTSGYMLDPPPPQPPAPTEEQVKAEQAGQDMALKQEEHDQTMEQRDEEHEQKLQIMQEQAQAALAVKRASVRSGGAK